MLNAGQIRSSHSPGSFKCQMGCGDTRLSAGGQRCDRPLWPYITQKSATVGSHESRAPGPLPWHARSPTRTPRPPPTRLQGEVAKVPWSREKTSGGRRSIPVLFFFDTASTFMELLQPFPPEMGVSGMLVHRGGGLTDPLEGIKEGSGGCASPSYKFPPISSTFTPPQKPLYCAPSPPCCLLSTVVSKWAAITLTFCTQYCVEVCEMRVLS